MDLQAASRLGGSRWNVAKILALVCFLLACGFLVVSLTGIARAGGQLPGGTTHLDAPWRAGAPSGQ